MTLFSLIFQLTFALVSGYNGKALGAWCNGNTWVSKTFVEGSNPSAPARKDADVIVSVSFIAVNSSLYYDSGMISALSMVNSGFLQFLTNRFVYW